MSTSGTSEGDEPRNGSAIASLYGLDAEEAALAEAICEDLLGAVGVDGRRFVERLRRTGRMDVALGLTPEIADALYARAHRWFAVGFPRRAEPIFRALCVAYPDTADYWVGLGICLRLGDQASAAGTALETALALRPDWEVPSFHLAELALLRGRLDAAKHYLQSFHRHATSQTPDAMRIEAQRLERALVLRRAR